MRNLIRNHILKVVIGGPRRLVLEGMKHVAIKHCVVIRVTEDFHDFLEAVQTVRPDLAIVDATDGCWQFENVLEALANVSPEIAILALVKATSGQNPDQNSNNVRLLPAGASTEDFERAIRRMASALAHPASVNQELRDEPLHPLGLVTPRQREILRLLCAAESTKRIAQTLGISSRTVEFHKYRMMKSLRVSTMTELIVLGIEAGLGASGTESLARRVNAATT